MGRSQDLEPWNFEDGEGLTRQLAPLAWGWFEARLPVCCGGCGRRITTLVPSASDPAAGVLGAPEHHGTRWFVSSHDGLGRRLTFVCPARRCGRPVTRRMDRLVRDFVDAVTAGRGKLTLGQADELTPSR